MEITMKTITFIATMFLALFFVSDVFAEKGPEYDKALQYYSSGNYKEAVSIFQDYVKKKPEASAYYRIGYGLYKLGKYNEAEVYFKQAYLIDPVFSPELTGVPQKYPERKIKKSKKMSAKKTLPEKKAPVPEIKGTQAETKPEAVPGKPPVKAVMPQKDQQVSVTPKKESVLPEQHKTGPVKAVVPQKDQQGSVSPGKESVLPEQYNSGPAGTVTPDKKFPPFPPSKPFMPRIASGGLMALFAGLGTFFIVLAIAPYLFFCLCLFLIAKKLYVPSPWIAWIPFVQIWTIVSSAGKPWWWILFMLVPIVNVFVSIYLWMCITENLRRNKWLGLLMLLPIINFIFLGILAFSKTETSMESATPA
jgi:hypothetical protein